MKPIMPKTFILALIVAFTGVTGCGSLKYPKAHRDKISKNFQSYSYTADLRATHVVKKGDRYWILSEPPPDVAFSFEDEEAFNIDLSLISVGESGGEKEGMMAGSEDLPLTGRSSYVVFARELFYRVNEMAFNTNATYDQYMKAMDKAFNVIEGVAELEAANIKHSAQVHINTGVSASQSLQEAATDTQKETTSQGTKPDDDYDTSQEWTNDNNETSQDLSEDDNDTSQEEYSDDDASQEYNDNDTSQENEDDRG